MIMRRTVIFLLLWMVLLVKPALGQDGGQDEDDPACGALVAATIHDVAVTCDALALGEMCYGNPLVLVETRSADIAFDEPGAMMPVTAVDSMYTQPPALDEAQWGIAVLEVRLDLPDDSARMLLLGGVDLQPAFSRVREDVPTCAYSVSDVVNVRMGPGTTYNRVDRVDPGHSLTLYGQMDGWGRAAEGWVSLEVGRLDCPNGDLILWESVDEVFIYPLQVLQLTLNDPGDCMNTPVGLVIDVPEDSAANLLINGVPVRVAGMAYVTPTADGALWITNLREDVGVVADGAWYPLDEGNQLLIREDEVEVLRGADGVDEQQARAMLEATYQSVAPEETPLTTVLSCAVGETIERRIELADDTIAAVSVSEDGAELVRPANGVLVNSNTYSFAVNCQQPGLARVTVILTNPTGTNYIYRYDITVTE